jgi:hypothetical protein
MTLNLIFINWSQSWTEVLLTSSLVLMELVTKSRRMVKEEHVTYYQNTLVMRSPSLFGDQARESLLSLVSALVDLF